MTKVSSFVLLGFAGVLAGCESSHINSPYWERDCQRNFSENSAEFQRCMDNARKHQAPVPQGSSVTMDPGDTNRPDDFELHKSRAR